MKTTFRLSHLLTIILLIFVFACSSDDAPSTPNNVSASNFSTTIEENPTTGLVLGALQATAGQGSLSYSLTSQTPNGALSINSATGELTIANNALFDFETNPIVQAIVTVTDDTSTTTATATVNLTNIKDLIYIHTATAENSSGNITYLDHPDLNGNPDAKIVFCHNWNGGTYNDKVTGLWYNGANWSVFNEDTTSIVEGSTYNIYIAKDGELITHIATAANQGSSNSYTVLDHPLLNDNPNANVILSTYYNPNSVYNIHNYSIWYDDSTQRWIIFTENLGELPLNSAFNVLIQGDTVETFKHQATAANISGNYTIIDHPSLNNNADATFVFTHNWGSPGDAANVVLDKTLSIWYTGVNWAIYTEDQSAMPLNITFDIVVTEN
ncbi:cadherin repeat domain-containing protein [uncultured Algibacter sp.]|uniref:cadherin repeat domain-containing protein n=1 Tax=uncultured Algibacter sp. TaxID=298659 RepID=UPI002614769E|nr:cadherin repeat domain-containing protein [uncultured Algibacter sp.]